MIGVPDIPNIRAIHAILVIPDTRVYKVHINYRLGAPMYKRQVDPISFPMPDRRYQYASPSFFSIKNFIWPPDPLNKGKIDFLLQI